MTLIHYWPLAVHVILHEYESDPKKRRVHVQAELFADRLCERLSSGERAPGIPVRLWRREIADGTIRLPQELPLNFATQNLIIVVVDQDFFEARSEWEGYVSRLVKECNDRGDLILPIAVHADAARFSSAFQDVNHVFVQDPIPLEDDERIFQAVFTALLRLLIKDLPKVFLCHAKNKSGKESRGEGEAIARTIRQYIYEETQLSCFFVYGLLPFCKQIVLLTNQVRLLPYIRLLSGILCSIPSHDEYPLTRS